MKKKRMLALMPANNNIHLKEGMDKPATRIWQYSLGCW